jgi:hypothetical protein
MGRKQFAVELGSLHRSDALLQFVDDRARPSVGGMLVGWVRVGQVVVGQVVVGGAQVGRELLRKGRYCRQGHAPIFEHTFDCVNCG